MNNQVTYPFFISNEFIHTSDSIWFFFQFFHVSEIFFENFEKWSYVTNFGCSILTRFHATYKNFPGDWINNCKVIATIFFKKGIFINIEIFFSNSYEFLKIEK